MSEVARKNASDIEAQVFYALALLSAASPLDKTHANQKLAAQILEPLFRQQPQHPGVAHYLIHACDNAEMARQGLPAARAYAAIAPSAPHALHMPSHIFTRLGLWDDSIASNQAARAAAHQQGDIGEELHAMDYLTYAYLQRGRDAEAAQVVEDLKSKSLEGASDFKAAYAATAMPVRYAIERNNGPKPRISRRSPALPRTSSRSPATGREPLHWRAWAAPNPLRRKLPSSRSVWNSCAPRATHTGPRSHTVLLLEA